MSETVRRSDAVLRGYGQQPSAALREEALERAVARWRNDDERRKIAARAVMRILRDWGVDSHTKLRLLGLSPSSRGQLGAYASGKTPLRGNEDTWRRVSDLIAIDRNLRLFAPENPDWRSRWPGSANRGLGGERPIDIMLYAGIQGIEQIRQHTARLLHS